MACATPLTRSSKVKRDSPHARGKNNGAARCPPRGRVSPLARPGGTDVTAPGPVLAVRNLTTAFRVDGVWTTVVNGISFEIGPRETVAIVGESGSGKSVTALSIMGLLPAANSRVTGEVRLEGRELLKLPEEQM